MFGLSYVSGISPWERENSGNDRGSKFLQFGAFEFTFAPHENSRGEAFIRVHHRSGLQCSGSPMSVEFPRGSVKTAATTAGPNSYSSAHSSLRSPRMKIPGARLLFAFIIGPGFNVRALLCQWNFPVGA